MYRTILQSANVSDKDFENLILQHGLTSNDSNNMAKEKCYGLLEIAKINL